MSGPPLFRADAEAFADELAGVLGAVFPPFDAGVTWVEQARADGLTYTERLERAAFMLAGESRRVLAETAALCRQVPDPVLDVEQAEWSLYAEVAALLELAPDTAQTRMEDARRLREFLPATLGKLRAGELSVAKTFVMLGETINLDPPELARVDAKAMQNTGGTRAQFRARLRRLIARLDPGALVLRRNDARRNEVGVWTSEAEDGLSGLNALIPAEDAALAWKAITERADELTVPGDTRSVGELRAAAYVDLLVHHADGTARVAWQVQVIVPVGTVLGIDKEDAHIPGHGPIGAEVAREIVARADELRRLLVDPPPAP